MKRPLIIDIFSPLPPLPTAIGYHTVAVLTALREHARVRVWTSQDGPVALNLAGVELLRFKPDTLPVPMLNRADATFFNLGNNAAFHRDIHLVARRVPGIVILHDTRLQHFFAAYAEHAGPDRAYYLDQLGRIHGRATRTLGETYLEGRAPLDALVDIAPMTLAALDGAIAAILHNGDEQRALAGKTHVPVYHLPLCSHFGPAPAREAATPRDPRAPSRLVMFGFIGENRRLLTILAALASMPDRESYRLDIYGMVEQAEDVDEAIAAHGLAPLVTRHGFVEESELDAALAQADLALNLRWPSMGEASASQLRIWSAKLPALVTRVGWYDQLPPDTVFMIDPDQEVPQLTEHLRALRATPARYRQAGENGRRVLEQFHSPAAYAEALIAIASEHAGHHARRVGHQLAERAARLLLELGPQGLARPLGGELSRRIAELTGS